MQSLCAEGPVAMFYILFGNMVICRRNDKLVICNIAYTFKFMPLVQIGAPNLMYILILLQTFYSSKAQTIISVAHG